MGLMALDPLVTLTTRVIGGVANDVPNTGDVGHAVVQFMQKDSDAPAFAVAGGLVILIAWDASRPRPRLWTLTGGAPLPGRDLRRRWTVWRRYGLAPVGPWTFAAAAYCQRPGLSPCAICGHRFRRMEHVWVLADSPYGEVEMPLTVADVAELCDVRAVHPRCGKTRPALVTTPC